MEPSLITTLVNTLGWGGVIVWTLWYNQTKQIPRILDTFEREQSEVRKTAETLRLSHENQVERILTSHKENFEKLVAAIDRSAISVQEMIKHCSSHLASVGKG